MTMKSSPTVNLSDDLQKRVSQKRIFGIWPKLPETGTKLKVLSELARESIKPTTLGASFLILQDAGRECATLSRTR
jgi:hypothetical protein